MQVVPDVDNELRDDEPSRKRTLPEASLTPPTPQLQQQQFAARPNVGDLIFGGRGARPALEARKTPVGGAPKRRHPGAVPVQRVHEDARPLTPLESIHFRHLLQRNNS